MFPTVPTTPYCDNTKCCDCDCDCDDTSSSNAAPPVCESSYQASVGTATTDINVKSDSEFSLYHSHLDLARLKLKSGDDLLVSWNFFPGQGAIYGAVYDATGLLTPKWQPVGRSGILSLIPYLNNEHTTPPGQYIVKTDRGTIFYESVYDTLGDPVIQYTPANNLPAAATYDVASSVFTEYNYETGIYFEFGGGGHRLVGRPLKRTDRNGNVLNYNYVKPNDTYFLYSITGDISGVIPYFQYANTSIPAPITSILLKDLSGADDRMVYFNYQATSAAEDTFLESIILPDGSISQYVLKNVSPYDISALVSEVDAEGHITYFGYSDPASKKDLVLTIEPEGVVTYYNYSGFNTEISKLGREPRSYNYDFWGSKSVPLVGQSANALGDTAKFDYDPDLGRIDTKQDERGFTSYYKYTDGGALSSNLRVYDGAETYYGYASNLQDMVKTIGPRNTLSLPVVTYYEYDTKRNRILEIDALGNQNFRIRDNVGRVSLHQDAVQASTYFNYANASGHLDSKVDPLAAVSYYGYDVYGNKLRDVSPRYIEAGSFSAFTTYYEYDKRDRQTLMTDPLGGTTYFGYTLRGDRAKQVDAQGTTTYFGYNGLRLMSSRVVSDPAGIPLQTEYYSYDIYKNRIAVRSPGGSSTYFGYDAADRQIARLDALQNSSYFKYDASGNQTAVVGPRWKESNFRAFTTYYIYDGAGRNSVVTDALHGCTYYRYDVADNRTRVQNARGNTTYFEFDALNRTAAQIDALSHATYFGYDAVGSQVRSQNPRGFTTYFAYDALRRRTCTTDPLGILERTAYDAEGNVICQMSADLEYGTQAYGETAYGGAYGQATYFAYDALNRMTVQIDALSNATYFGYDAVGSQVRNQDPLGYVTYFGYDALHRRTVTVDPLGFRQRTAYDADGNVVRQTRAEVEFDYGVQAYGPSPYGGGSLGQTTYFEYDALDRMTKQIDPLAHTTYFTYDAAGNVVRTLNPRFNPTDYIYDALDRRVKSIDALSGETYFVYDKNSNLILQRDPRGHWTQYFYDELDRLSLINDALGGHQTRLYDPAGNIACIIPDRGGATYFTYDELNRTTASVDGVFNTTYFEYDPAGNRQRIVSPRGYASNFSYDALNRPVSTRNAVAESSYFGYDAVGNLLRSQNALGHTTYFKYDPLRRLTLQTDALDNRSYFAYDAAGNRTVEQDSRGGTTYYVYDPLNRVERLQDPLGIVAYYGYDANSNLAQTLDNNRTAVYFAYDELDRRTQIKYPAETQDFQYDANGNLTSMQDAWGTSSFSYDWLNRETSRTTPRGDTMDSDYDRMSNRTLVRYPQDGKICYYEYDNAQRMSQVYTPYHHFVYFAYDASSNVVDRTYYNGGNDILSHAEFDAADRMSSLRYSCAGTPVAYFDYRRDQGGRIVSIARESNLAVYYTYDNIDRLTSEVWRKKSDSSQVYAFSYSYDPTGNRLAMRREGTGGAEYESAYYAYAVDNSLTKRKTFQPPSTTVSTYYYYDANGALIKEWDAGGSAATYYEYGPNQLVTKVVPKTGNAWQFYYDGRLNRYKIDKGGGVVTYLLWDGLNCLEERDGSGNLIVRYAYSHSPIYGIGSCVEIYIKSTNKLYTLTTDHRGTVHNLVDMTGAVVGTRYYDAFGVILGEGDTGFWPVDLGYQTNWMTVKIGGRFYCLSKYRIYEPDLGIFLSRDFLPNMNKYIGFNDNPVNYIDSDGNDAELSVTVEENKDLGITGGVIKLGIELTKTGELRSEYDKFVVELKKMGVKGEAANNARDRLKLYFREKQTPIGSAVTQAILDYRKAFPKDKVKCNPFKPNKGVSATGKVFCAGGKVITFVGVGMDVVDINEAVQVGGVTGVKTISEKVGSFGGACAGAELGALACAWGGPYGIGFCSIVGAVAGGIAGEQAVQNIFPSGTERPIIPPVCPGSPGGSGAQFLRFLNWLLH